MPVAARDKNGVIAELTRHLTNRWGCDYAEVLGAVQEREAGGSTGIGFGVAIPHAPQWRTDPRRGRAKGTSGWLGPPAPRPRRAGLHRPPGPGGAGAALL